MMTIAHRMKDSPIVLTMSAMSMLRACSAASEEPSQPWAFTGLARHAGGSWLCTHPLALERTAPDTNGQSKTTYEKKWGKPFGGSRSGDNVTGTNCSYCGITKPVHDEYVAAQQSRLIQQEKDRHIREDQERYANRHNNIEAWMMHIHSEKALDKISSRLMTTDIYACEKLMGDTEGYPCPNKWLNDYMDRTIYVDIDKCVVLEMSKDSSLLGRIVWHKRFPKKSHSGKFYGICLVETGCGLKNGRSSQIEALCFSYKWDQSVRFLRPKVNDRDNRIVIDRTAANGWPMSMM